MVAANICCGFPGKPTGGRGAVCVPWLTRTRRPHPSAGSVQNVPRTMLLSKSVFPVRTYTAVAKAGCGGKEGWLS